MNITHVFHHFAPCRGGVETVIMQLCRQMQGKHDCSVVCLNKCQKGKEKLPAKGTINGINVERIPFLDFGFYKFAPGVSRKIKDADILHVHGTNFFSDFLGLTAWLHGKKMVLSTHGGIFHTKKLGLLKKIYFFGFCRITLRAFKKIACVSKNDFELFSKIVAKEKLVIIENGIEFEKFFNAKKDKRQNSFVFVGRMGSNKRIDLLIDAFIEVGKNNDFELYIAGNDIDGITEALKKKAEAGKIQKNVFFHGEVSEKRLLELMGIAEFFVSASEYEGFGITAVEAMACGCIPILNNIDSFGNFVQEGKNGFIADFNNAKEASEKIIFAIKMQQKEKEKIIASAIARAKEFSWEKKAAEYEKIYLEVAK